MQENETPKDQNLDYDTTGDKRKFNKGGRKPGSMNKATKDVKITKARFLERVNQNADKLFNAQLDLAIGEKYLMVVRTVGQGAKQRRETSIVTDEDTIRQYLDETLEDTDTEHYFISTKPANNQALDSLLNRSFGKAPEKIELEGGLFNADKLEIKVINNANSQSDTEQQTADSQGTAERPADS